MTAVREQILEFNSQVEWAPEWTGAKRMGEWLSNIKDWAISRERYWGTPIPVWICQECQHEHCIGSIDEMISMKTNDSPTPPELHRPYVDDVKLNCNNKGCSGEMIREPYVMDCWFDSGCASFAQWHYPFENKEKFEGVFPVDYICEAVDQTRGWFYSLLAVSTTVFDNVAYKRCLSLGHILDKEGKKMSKSRGNVVNPWDHFNKEGSDSIRWYMMTQSAPWTPTNFDSNGVRESYAKMFLTLWNVHRFYSDYAALDGFDPDEKSGKINVRDRSPLDKWILSRMATVAETYHENFISWDFHKAGRELENFVINDLSNWYVRRSRRRLWNEDDSNDKRACQHTLHEVLLTVCRLMAPVAPFIPDQIHRDLTGTSVHLTDWPVGSSLVPSNLPPQNWVLEQEMALVRKLAETGRRVRVDAGRRQRLPCKYGWIVGGPDISEFHEILAEELNVELLTTEDDLDRFQKIQIAPNRKALGRKCRQDLPAVLDLLADADPDNILLEIEAEICIIEGYDITMEDIEIKRVEKEGYAAATISIDEIGDVSLVLDMKLNDELLSKGLARDIIRHVQAKRKEINFDIESSIKLEVWVDGQDLFAEDWDHIQTETRAGDATLNEENISNNFDSFEVDGVTVKYIVSQID
jgi:isoleucyl-tRNA synthetase